MSTAPAVTPNGEFDQDVLSLADVYAEALLQAAEEKGQVEEVAAELADLVAYMAGHPDFEQFLTTESVDDEPRRATLEKLFRGRMSDPLLNMLQVLNNRFRTGLIRPVAQCVRLRMQQRHNQEQVTVETAMPLTDPLRDQIRAAVGDYIRKEAILIEQVRPELIGGLVLRIGDLQVDASVATRLEMMRKQLETRAVAEVRRGVGYEVED
jgi:F-type H+-transporting ATPase subunit delta